MHPAVDAGLAKIVIALITDTAVIVCVVDFSVARITENCIGER